MPGQQNEIVQHAENICRLDGRYAIRIRFPWLYIELPTPTHPTTPPAATWCRPWRGGDAAAACRRIGQARNSKTPIRRPSLSPAPPLFLPLRGEIYAPAWLKSAKKGHQTHFFNELFDTCFMVYFGRRTRHPRLFYNLLSFEQTKCEIEFMFLMPNLLSNPMITLVFL